MVLCALIPRLELLAACSADWELLRRPAALAPHPGGAQVIGQASRAAEAHGIHEGMRMGEALARCPDLELIPPDPVRAEALWEELLEGLEEIGAAIEPGPPGEVLFESAGLLGLYRDLDGVVAAARKAVAPHRAVAAAIRLAAAPAPFAARLAAGLEAIEGVTGVSECGPAGGRYRSVTPEQADRFLASLPTASLAHGLGRRGPGGDGKRAEHLRLIGSLERLGLNTLGDLAEVEPGMVADRFGALGLEARRLARGGAEPLHPRRPGESLEATLELADDLDGTPLDRALEALVGRFLAHPGRQGREIRSLALSATLAAGGSWRSEAPLNSSTASPETLTLALTPRLAELPGPVSSLTLQAIELGSCRAGRHRLFSRPEEIRRGRIGEAVRQTRAAAGGEAILRILMLEPGARLPERRAALAPYEPESEDPA